MKKHEKRIITAFSMIILSSCALAQNSKKTSTQSMGQPSKSYVDTSKPIDNNNETGYGTNLEPISYRSGSGGGSGYALGNRKALSKPTPKYNCTEEGKVVVEVTVDQNGKTISATPGIKGTTNTARCLLDQAKIAAMNTKWDADDNAPAKQVGKIIYNFSLN